MRGLIELRAAGRESIGLLIAALLFGLFVNILLLTGPLYMLQIYDRVLGSRSEETLVALSILMTGLFLAMGMLDYARSRLMVIVGARFQDRLDRRVFAASLRRSAQVPTDGNAVTAQRDLEAVQKFIASPVLRAMFDIPWTPFFIAAIFVFHPWLGYLAVAGGVFLVIMTALHQLLTKTPQQEASLAAIRSDRLSDQLKAEAELLQALGMTGAGFDRWQPARSQALSEGVNASGRAEIFVAISKSFRQFLQSAMLGLGAWLVLKGALSSGAMIAASILLGRALAPIETATSQWAIVQRASEGWARLADLLTRSPMELPRTALPRPQARLEAENVTVAPPGETVPALRTVSFRVEPGQALGVIGPSGSGKSTLARAVIGAWHPAAGTIRLDGATLAQYDQDLLGGYMGYLPQRVTLFNGTIADNIARLHANPDSAKIVAAARRAAAHEMILKLPRGYDTPVSETGGRLSGGQSQRIGLARALYGDPVLLVLDEPNANLDNDGLMALNRAIRLMKGEGKSILVMAHQPAALQECDLLLVLEDGLRKAFGPRDRVLREMARNHTDLVRTVSPGNVA